MKADFNTFLDYTIASMVLTVLAMINDLSWQNTEDNKHKIDIMEGMESGTEVAAISAFNLVNELRKMSLPVFGKTPLLRISEIIIAMGAAGDISIENIQGGHLTVYFLPLAEVKKIQAK